MSSIYKGVLTNNGKALIAQATTANRVGFSHIAIGDGNGSVPTPTDTRTALVRERHRLALNSVEINPNNRNQIICEAIIPSNVGGWTIRELGLYAGSTMLVHSNYPATYKPTQTEGGARELVIRMVINVQSADVIALTLNDSLVYTTREWVETNFVNHNEVINNLTSNETNKPLSANQGKILNDNKVAKTATITAGNGLTGGGDLSANRSLALGTPSQITATSSNSVTAESHSHAIDKASTTGAGIVQLNDSLTSTSNTQALTANQGKILDDKKLDKTTVFTVEGNNKVYRYHDVAMFNKRTESVIGVVALKLPSYFTTMYMMTLQGFNYDHSSSWSAEISAYQYTATIVIKPSITIHGNAPFNKIQFASKNGSQYILLGETSTIWRYPAIHIKEVLTHFNNQQHWATGYEFSVETDLSSFQVLATPPLYGTPRALSAEKLVTPRQLSISGDATATANFDGTNNANLALTLANTGVTAGTYQSVTVDAKGRVSSGLAIVNGLVTATTATGTDNQATTNNNTYLNLVTRTGTTNSSAGSSTKITGQNGVTVSSDTNGNLLIDGNIINNLTSTDTNKPLSALQGKTLFDALKQMGFDNLDKGATSRAGIDLNTLTNVGATYVNYNSSVIQNTSDWWQRYNLPSAEIKYGIVFTLREGGSIIYQTLYSAGNGQVWFRYISVGTSNVLNNKGWTRLDGADWNDVRNKPTASLTQAGITQLNSAVNSNLETQSATPKAVKTAYDKAIDVEQQLNQLRSALQIQRKDYSARLTPTHNNFRTQTVNVTGSVEVLPDGRIIQRFTFTCPVIYFHRHNLSAFYREKLGVSSFAAEDSPLLELPLWTAMPNKVQEARIHLSSNLNHNAWGEALEFAYDWDSIFNQHVNIKDKAYFCFNRVKGSQDEPVTFNIVVEGY